MSTTALITGGTSGIGRAVANKLAQLGIHVVVVGRNEERGEKAVAEIRAWGGQADFISSDLRDASSAREVARRAVELGNGHVDILVNNAGIYPFGLTHEMSEELFDKVYSLNVKVPYFLVAELAPLMAATMRPTRGVPRLTTSAVASVDSIGRRADAYWQVASSNCPGKRSRRRRCPSSCRSQRGQRP